LRETKALASGLRRTDAIDLHVGQIKGPCGVVRPQAALSVEAVLLAAWNQAYEGPHRSMRPGIALLWRAAGPQSIPPWSGECVGSMHGLP